MGERDKDFMMKAVDEINRLRPAFAVVCGDLVDAWPGAPHRAEQIRDFKQICKRVDPSVPLVCVCGNHDVGNRPNAATVEEYRSEFGDEYFSFWVHGVKCIVVNSQLWKDDSEAPELRQAHDVWLAQELADAAGARHVLVFCHVPLFIKDPGEPAGFFNIDPTTRSEILSLLSKHGVRTIFCGHYHRNAGGFFRTGSGAEMELVVTGAVGGNIKDNPNGNPLDLDGMDGPVMSEDESGMRLVKVSDTNVSHRWFSYRELEALSPETAADSV